MVPITIYSRWVITIFIIMDDLTFDQMMSLYKANPDEFTRGIEAGLNARVLECDWVDNNAVFDSIKSGLLLEHKHEYISITHSCIVTAVEAEGGFNIKIHNCLTIWLSGGSHLRFSPHANGLEITRLYVLPANQGQGYGTLLMSLMLKLIGAILPDMPTIQLTVTGSVGYADNLLHNSIDRQIKFFGKFGFTVKERTPQSSTLVRIGRPFS